MIEENIILISIIVIYIVCTIIGRKIFHMDKELLTSILNLGGACLLVIYLLIERVLTDSYILLIALGVIILGSIVRIKMYQNSKTK